MIGLLSFLEFKTQFLKYKKVLLRECKRHTDQGGYLPWPGGTYPGWWVSTLAGGVPTLAGGYLPWPRGVPPIQTWQGRYPPGR